MEKKNNKKENIINKPKKKFKLKKIKVKKINFFKTDKVNMKEEDTTKIVVKPKKTNNFSKENKQKKRIEAIRNNANKQKAVREPKKLSKKVFVFIILMTVAIFIVCYLLFGLLISAGLTFLFICGMFITQILDILPRENKIRKLIKSLSIIVLIFAIIGVIAFIGFFIYIVLHAPEFDVSKLERGETTLIYDKDKKLIATIGTEKREKVTYDELPEVFIDAVVATEDSRFFQHNGFDAPRFIKATIGQLLGRNSGGASTLTMQVAKNNFTEIDVSLTRKFTDIYLSIFKIERAFTKQEIIEFYVNAPFLGSSSYGVEQAAQTYFSKTAKELNLSEAALIAGLFQAPGAYDPNLDSEAAYDRRETVLYLMVKHGYITQEEADIANAISIKDLLSSTTYKTTNPYQGYIDTVLNEVEDKTGLDPLVYPMLIYTNMDIKKQNGINDIMSGKTFKWPNKTVQSGIAVIESNTGKILALGAGRNLTGERLFNYATDINRQIGSNAKPLFDYGPGIEYNNWSTGKIFNDSRVVYGGSYMSNFDGAYRGKITLRYSLRDSRNVPALLAFREVDNAKIKQFVTTLGITPEIDENGGLHEAHSVGAFNGSNPLAMAAAYAAFSNGGSYYEPYTVSKIVLRESNEELEFKSDKVKAMSDSTAYMITDILQQVASDIGVRAAAGTPVATKTGTTNYDAATRKAYNYPSVAAPDGWITGYSTNISMSIWSGYIQNTKNVYLTQTQMVSLRNGLYKAAAGVVFDKNSGSFVKPKSVVSVKIEKGTDPIALPSSNTPSSMIITELFKRGTEPTEISNVYRPLNNVTDLNVTETNKVVNLSWTGVSKPTDLDDKNFGDFGYYIYLNGKNIGFTTNTNYTYNGSSIYGTYKVVTSYRSNSKNASNGVTYNLSSNIVFQQVNCSDDITIAKGSTYIDSCSITVLENATPVIGTTSTKITNSAGSSISQVDTSIADTYTITYTISYLGESKEYTKKVIVTENSN